MCFGGSVHVPTVQQISNKKEMGLTAFLYLVIFVQYIVLATFWVLGFGLSSDLSLKVQCCGEDLFLVPFAVAID